MSTAPSCTSDHLEVIAMSSTVAKRSQAWFPGRYVPVRHIQGVEVLPRRRGNVQVAKTTIHGTASELRHLAAQMLRAADLVDPKPPAEARAA
jgi:hypothetical protein